MSSDLRTYLLAVLRVCSGEQVVSHGRTGVRASLQHRPGKMNDHRPEFPGRHHSQNYTVPPRHTWPYFYTRPRISCSGCQHGSQWVISSDLWPNDPLKQCTHRVWSLSLAGNNNTQTVPSFFIYIRQYFTVIHIYERPGESNVPVFVQQYSLNVLTWTVRFATVCPLSWWAPQCMVNACMSRKSPIQRIDPLQTMI